MQLLDIGESVAVKLQVSLCGDSLAPHHVDKRLVPLQHVLSKFQGKVGVSVYKVFPDLVDVESVCADYILDLPHI